MSEEKFYTHLFIDESEKRPSLWDMTSSHYSNKISKRKVWQEVIVIFCDPQIIRKQTASATSVLDRAQNWTDPGINASA